MAKPPSYLAGWIWLIYLALFAFSIPWYWYLPGFPIAADAIWFGYPAWAVVAVFGSACISTFTAWLWMRQWPIEEEGDSKS